MRKDKVIVLFLYQKDDYWQVFMKYHLSYRIFQGKN